MGYESTRSLRLALAAVVGFGCLAIAATTQPSSRSADLVPFEVRVLKRTIIYEGVTAHDLKFRFPDVEITDYGQDVESTKKLQPKFTVPRGTMNLALHKPVTSSDKDVPIAGKLEEITDGEHVSDAALVAIAPGHWVQVDLQESCEIYVIAIWRTGGQPDVCPWAIIQASDDPEFKQNVHTLFNNDRKGEAGLGKGTDRLYVENYVGKWIDAKGVKARYVRSYAGKLHQCDWNVYSEIEVYGVPAKH